MRGLFEITWNRGSCDFLRLHVIDGLVHDRVTGKLVECGGEQVSVVCDDGDFLIAMFKKTTKLRKLRRESKYASVVLEVNS